MYQGNWKCSACGGAITELPFQPRSESGLTCRDCWMKQKGQSGTSTPPPEESGSSVEAPMADIPEEAGLANEPPPFEGFDEGTSITPGEKPRFAGSWECAQCGGEITSLPFQPRDTSNLKCLDCFKASR
jgi:CxxC-x17-CxxC domain-containing protein